MQQRSLYFPMPGHLAAIATTIGLSLALIAVATSPQRAGTDANIERELATISERSEEIAAFERNIHPVRLDAPETHAVPFAGFLASDTNLKPGRQIALARYRADDAKLEILDVRRITQTATVTRPAALKMNLLLIKGRLVDRAEDAGDRIVPHDNLDADEQIVHLLFAVSAPPASKLRPLTTPALQQSL